jgi:two-component system sensor histidine kinase/response regulator
LADLDRTGPSRRPPRCWPPPFDRIEQEGVQSQVIEYRVRHEDGHWLWVEDRSCVTERHADGRARITAGVLSDISARQKDRQQINSQNRALRMMSGIAQALIRQSDERQMLMEVCSVIVDIGGYHRAWIGEALPDADKSIRPVAHADGEEGYLADLDLSWGEQPSGQAPAGRAVRSGQPCIVQDIDSDAASPPGAPSPMATAR